MIGKRRFCVAECSCGNIISVEQKDAASGKTVSCGCGRIKHGVSGDRATSEYKIWITMKQRCLNRNANSYKNYGLRGITVCDTWIESFCNFIRDMGARPSIKHTLDRIDHNLGYSPENCRWATWAVQSRNKRTNNNITAFGETKCINDWAKDSRSGVCTANAIARRMKNGMSAESAIASPNESPVLMRRNRVRTNA